MVVPVFGAIANFGCMAFYIIGPLEGLGSWKEPSDGGRAIAVFWGIYGAIYFVAQLQEARKGYADGQSQPGLIICASAVRVGLTTKVYGDR